MIKLLLQPNSEQEILIHDKREKFCGCFDDICCYVICF